MIAICMLHNWIMVRRIGRGGGNKNNKSQWHEVSFNNHNDLFNSQRGSEATNPLQSHILFNNHSDLLKTKEEVRLLSNCSHTV